MSVVANVAINVDSRNAVSKLRQVQQGAQATERAVNGLGAAVGKLAAAFAAVQAVKFVFVQAAEVESQRRSLEVLTGSAQKAGQIIKELQQLGAVTPFTSTELIDAAKRLQAFGVESGKVVEVTRRLADASGATGAELQGLVTAFGQVQAKGRLQGEELLQFQERGIALQEELRKMYGMTGEEFQKALSKGQISAEAVEVALVRLTDAGGKYANGAIAQSDTLQGRLSTLQDSFQRLAQNIGTFFAPVFKFLINRTNELIERLNRGFAGASEEIRQRAGATRLQRAGVARTYTDAQGNVYSTITGRLVQPAKVTSPSAKGAMPPLAAPRVGGTGTGTGGGSAAGSSAAANDAKRAAEQMQQQLKAADDINFALKNRLAIAQQTESVAKRMVEFDVRQNEIAKEYDELKKTAKSADELALINANQIIEQRIAQIEYEQDINDLLAQRAVLMANILRQAAMPTVYNELETQEVALQAVLDKYPAIGEAANAAATLATSGMAAMISGTKSAQEVFADFLNSIANALMQTAAKMIAQYIAIGIARMFAGIGAPGGFAPSGPLAAVGDVGTGFNFDVGAMIPGRAKGGPVSSGQAYMVGERGPELFVPGTGGSVVPTQDLRSAMNGRGAAAGSPVLNMSFQSTNVGGVEYVSRDQLEAAMAATRRQAAKEGANRGMNMALDKIQNSPSTRSRVGIR